MAAPAAAPAATVLPPELQQKDHFIDAILFSIPANRLVNDAAPGTMIKVVYRYELSIRIWGISSVFQSSGTRYNFPKEVNANEMVTILKEFSTDATLSVMRMTEPSKTFTCKYAMHQDQANENKKEWYYHDEGNGITMKVPLEDLCSSIKD